MTRSSDTSAESHSTAANAAAAAPTADADQAARQVVEAVERAAAAKGVAAEEAAAEAKDLLRELVNPALQRYHGSEAALGMRLANAVTGGMGSWRFIIIQTVLVIIWVTLNVVGLVRHWDVYPFILLNLMFSVQAAYASPLILMAGNVAAARDRDLWEHDYQINQEAYAKIEAIELRTQEMVNSMKELLSRPKDQGE